MCHIDLVQDTIWTTCLLIHTDSLPRLSANNFHQHLFIADPIIPQFLIAYLSREWPCFSNMSSWMARDITHHAQLAQTNLCLHMFSFQLLWLTLTAKYWRFFRSTSPCISVTIPSGLFGCDSSNLGLVNKRVFGTICKY
jgi:hypothetical protein